MSRTLLAWIPAGLLAFATGCAMCAHPYDETGPTVGSIAGDVCQPGARAGSILAAPIGPVYSGAPMEGELLESESPPAPTPAPAPPPPTAPGPSGEDVSRFFPGVPRESILSVTDRKVEDSAPELPADDSSVQTQPAPRTMRTYAQPTSSKGWNARAPRTR